MEIETDFILLFVAATGVAVAVRRTRIPYNVALVLAGLVLGTLHLFPALALTKTLLFSVILPGLVFEAAYHTMIEITLTTVAAYGSFVAAESLHFSGVIAAVAAGMLCGNYGARRGGMSPSTRIATKSFWEYLAFALSSIVFLLIGFEVHVSVLLDNWIAILLAYAVVTVGRAAMVCVGCAAVRVTRERFPWSWTPVLTWGVCAERYLWCSYRVFPSRCLPGSC